VPAAKTCAALDLLRRNGVVTVHPDVFGHHSSFLGAVLRTLPGATVSGTPPHIAIAGAGQASSDPSQEVSFEGDLSRGHTTEERGEQATLDVPPELLELTLFRPPDRLSDEEDPGLGGSEPPRNPGGLPYRHAAYSHVGLRRRNRPLRPLAFRLQTSQTSTQRDQRFKTNRQRTTNRRSGRMLKTSRSPSRERERACIFRCVN
jgi:hypothetical protein